MKKKNYCSPKTEVLELEVESLLNNNSWIDTGGDAGAYDAKEYDGIFKDIEEPTTSYNVWE